MFWVDEIVEDVLKKSDKDSYLVTDWKTPSGHVHIGSLRGIAIHDVVKRGLESRGKKAVFQYGFDDFDPMDGLPVYIDQSWQEHMGKPLCNVPAPDGTSENYAMQFANEFRKVFEGLGIEPKIVYTSEMYKNGEFNESIKTILDNSEIIRKIYKEVSGSDKGNDWYPLQVVCPNCGKTGTTKVIGWDGEEVEFTCEENLVKWAKGCGHTGKISPFDGKAKLPWKVEWPSKWNITQTDIEGEGKDHSAAGGSRQVADNIYREVFKKQPPYDVPYEFFTLAGGLKMSSSKGLGASAKDFYEFLPANILRFLCVRTKYKRAIDVDLEGDSIPLLYDEYDRCALDYQKEQKSDLAQAYYYAEIDPENPPAGGQPKYLLRFSKIAYMLQMPRVDILEYAKAEKGSELTDAEKQEIENRTEVAKMWLEKFAPENYKFTISEELPDAASALSSQQKSFLSKVLKLVKEKEWTGEELHKKIHEIKTEMNIEPRLAFTAIYWIFIGKDSGPQAGWLLASLDKNFVIKRLEEI